jgi:hypothetical protein
MRDGQGRAATPGTHEGSQANHRQSPRDRNGSCSPFIQKHFLGSQLFGERDDLGLSPIEEGHQFRWHRRDGMDGGPGGLTEGFRSGMGRHSRDFAPDGLRQRHVVDDPLQ